MNAKLSKKLRKIALGLAVAAEEQGVTVKQTEHLVDRSGTITVAKNTLKGAYRSLKKGHQAAGKGLAYTPKPQPAMDYIEGPEHLENIGQAVQVQSRTLRAAKRVLV